jgi:hypothetical protein
LSIINEKNLSANKLKHLKKSERETFLFGSFLITAGILSLDEKLYKFIISNLQENSSLIKVSCQLDLNSVAFSDLEKNIQEGFIQGKDLAS